MVTDNRKEPATVALIRITYQDADSGASTEVTLDPVVFVGLVHATSIMWHRLACQALVSDHSFRPGRP